MKREVSRCKEKCTLMEKEEKEREEPGDKRFVPSSHRARGEIDEKEYGE